MKKKEQKQRKVTSSDLVNNYEKVMEAAKAGRLVILEDKTDIPSREDVINNVRVYVGQISSYSTKAWRESVSLLWEEMFKQDRFVNVLMPKANSIKCRDFNKNYVMRFVGYLRSEGVYDESWNDTQYCMALEHNSGDSSYRAYIGKGIESKFLKFYLNEIIKSFLRFNIMISVTNLSDFK